MVKLMPCHRRILQVYSLRGILCLLSLIVPTKAFGTAAIIIKTNELTVIAADSLETDQLERTISSQCKIYSIGNLFFIPYRVRSGPSGYDAVATAREVAKGSKGIRDTARRFIDAIQPPIIAALTFTRNTNPTIFQRITDPPTLGAIFAGYENGELIVNISTFDVVDSNATPLTLRVEQDSSCEEECIFPVAPKGFPERYKREHPKFAESLAAPDLIGAAKRFVQQAIDEHPSTVGPPLSALVISPLRTYWETPGLCQDIQK